MAVQTLQSFDIFDIESTFTHKPVQVKTHKRRKTCHDEETRLDRSASKHAKRSASTGKMTDGIYLQSGDTIDFGGTQAARENVLMPEDSTAGTIQVSTSERDSLVREALGHSASDTSSEHMRNVSDGAIDSPVPWPTASSRSRSSQAASLAKDSQSKAMCGSSQPTPSRVPDSLPREKYEARPSRSRSTQLPRNDKVDWSTIPGRKSRKRNHTDTANVMITQDLLDRAAIARLEDSSSLSLAPSSKTSHPVPESLIDELALPVEKPRQVVVEIVLPPRSEVETADDKSIEADSSQMQDTIVVAKATQEIAPQPTLPEKEKAVFAMPSQPASATKKKNAKARRAQTTIFEDHVGLSERPQGGESLIQQQSTRKKRGRPRKNFKDEIPETQQTPEVTVDSSQVSVAKGRAPALQTSRGSPGLDVSPGIVCMPSPPPEPMSPELGPKHIQGLSPPQEIENEPEDLLAEVCVAPPPRRTLTRKKSASTSGISDAVVVAEESAMNTDNPEKESQLAVNTIERVTHSPIKKTGSSTFRVGLSRRQRIAPLLKMSRK